MGTMEHMHLYGEAPILVSARKFCYTNIEAALENLYSFAAEQEYDAPYSFATRQTKLQENMERAAQQIELAYLKSSLQISWKSTTPPHWRTEPVSSTASQKISSLSTPLQSLTLAS